MYPYRYQISLTVCSFLMAMRTKIRLLQRRDIYSMSAQILQAHVRATSLIILMTSFTMNRGVRVSHASGVFFMVPVNGPVFTRTQMQELRLISMPFVQACRALM